MMRYDGKVVLITAGGAGIGRALVRAFAREGASIVFIDTDNAAGQENAEYVRSAGGDSIFIHGDVAVERDIQRTIEAALSAYGHIDILINNAGIGCGGTLDTRPKADWDRVIAVNLTAPYLFAQGCVPHMPEGSAILNIASTRALMSEADTEPYSATKGGLLALTHSLAVSLAHRVRVNCISPGWIDTSSYQRSDIAHEPVHSEADRLQHPAGRVGVPEDIANAALFLCSAEAGFITGQNIIIDGGMTIKMIYA